YVYTAPFSALMTESAARLQEMAPSREAGDALYAQMVERAKKTDANNQVYAIEAVMDYDPSKDLEKIKARLLAINFADDAVNPPPIGEAYGGEGPGVGCTCAQRIPADQIKKTPHPARFARHPPPSGEGLLLHHPSSVVCPPSSESHNASSRRRNARGFSANRRPATFAAAFTWAASRAAISGADRKSVG